MIKNIWLSKRWEKNILKVIEWAHRNSKNVEKLSKDDIIEAMQKHLRDSSHA